METLRKTNFKVAFILFLGVFAVPEVFSFFLQWLCMCSCSFSVRTTPALTCPAGIPSRGCTAWLTLHVLKGLMLLTSVAFREALRNQMNSAFSPFHFCTGAWVEEMWNKIVHLAACLLSLNEVGEQVLACVWITKTCKQAVSVGKIPHSRRKSFCCKILPDSSLFFFFLL